MQKNNPTFSLVIIGFNTAHELGQLLKSINQVKYDIKNLEIIYIDDGSTDPSLQTFNNYDLRFQKKSFGFTQNKGRVFATQKGIDIAKNEWVLFIQSNMKINFNILQSYAKAIMKSEGVAFGGTIDYQSSDLQFTKYLNNIGRGIKQYRQYEIIQYRHLLFGNAVIKKSIFDEISLNCQLKHYGGEELEFAFRLNQKYPNKIISCIDAKTTRINHPPLIKHYKRLIEFGKYNFPLLNKELQQTIIKYQLFIIWKNYLKWPIIILNKILLNLYYIGIKPLIVIKLILFTSLLRGYYSKAS